MDSENPEGRGTQEKIDSEVLQNGGLVIVPRSRLVRSQCAQLFSLFLDHDLAYSQRWSSKFTDSPVQLPPEVIIPKRRGILHTSEFSHIVVAPIHTEEAVPPV